MRTFDDWLKIMDEEQIRTLAYFKWEAAGKPDGRSEEFWQEAEKEIIKNDWWNFFNKFDIMSALRHLFDSKYYVSSFTTSLDYDSTENVAFVGNSKVWETAKTTKFKKCLKSAIGKILK